MLNGPGTAPVQLLAVDSAAQFTAPNAIANRYLQTAVSGTWHLSDVLSVQGNAYYSFFPAARGSTAIRPTTSRATTATGLLCQDVDDYSTTRGGATIPAFLGDNPESYNELDTQTTNTNGYGASAQVTDTGTVFGLTNHAVAGVSFDGSQTEFSATAYIGGVTDITRVFIGPGVVIDEPGNNVPCGWRFPMAIMPVRQRHAGPDPATFADRLRPFQHRRNQPVGPGRRRPHRQSRL